MIRAIGAFVLLALLLVPAPAQAGESGAIRIGGASFGTLQAALDAARPGDVITVSGGVHLGPFEINASIALLGSDDPLLIGPGTGTVLTIRAPHVTVDGFRVEGSGTRHDRGDAAIAVLAANATLRHNTIRRSLFGVWVAEAPDSRIEDNLIVGDPGLDEARRGDGIRLWYSPHATVRNNTLEGARDFIVWYAEETTIEDNTITHGRYGLHLMYCNEARIFRNRIEESSVGIYAMSSANVEIAWNHVRGNRGTSGYALAFKDADQVDVHDNILADNAVGAYLDTTPFTPGSPARFSQNVLATNDIGVLLLPAVSGARFDENTFWDNMEHVDIHGAHASGENAWAGNYWSGFVGYDADGDGYSETPYRAERLFERMQDTDPRLRALTRTPLAEALDAAANAFPIVKPEPKLQDDRPRTMPGEVPFAPAAGGSKEAAARPAFAAIGTTILLLAFIPVLHRRSTMSHPTRDDPPLSVRDLAAGYDDRTILSHVDLELRPGEAVALWGVNGAGKTTFLKAILGLVPHTGSVSVRGVDAKGDGRAARRAIGYVPQEIHLEDARVLEVMRTYAALRGARREDAELLLYRLGLQDHMRKRTSELSGGLRQRLALALALLTDPPILLLDEPTANLDARARGEYVEELHLLIRQGKTILFTSHRTEEVAALASRVMILHGTHQETLPAARFLDGKTWEVRA